MELLFLGTSAGAPSASRNVQSCALRLESGEYVVVDGGEGTQQQLLKASSDRSGHRFRPSRTNLILVTHLHGDHSFGLPGLVVYLDNAATEKAPPLHIVGPVGVAAFLRTALILSRTELKRGYRVTELATPAPTGGGAYEGAALCTTAPPVLHPDERAVSEVLAPNDDGMFALELLTGCSLTAAPLAHGSIACVGYRFQEADAPGSIDAQRAAAEAERAGDDARRICRALRECSLNGAARLALADGSELNVADGFVGAVTRRGRAVVVLGDCCHAGGVCSDATLRLAADADVLVHEATLDDAFAALALERGHSTPSDAARVAARAGASHLVLWHFSPRYRNDDAFRATFTDAVRAHFGGALTLASDFDRVAVPREKKVLPPAAPPP
jgi:ribonuclease Z